MATSGRGGKASRSVRRMHKSARSAFKALLVALALATAGLLGAIGWLVMIYAEEHGPGRGKLVEISLPPGVTVRTVAYRLAGQGALAEPSLFELYAGLRLSGARSFGAGDTGRLREGTVALYDDMTPSQVLQRVAYGFGSASLRVMLPEGYTRYDIGERLERFGICSAHDFIAATEDAALLAELGVAGPSAEGYLFPDTYSLREGSDPRNVVRRLVERGRELTKQLFADNAAAFAELQSTAGLDAHDVVTLASIVEKEARVAEERPIIAGVFLNRLKDPKFTPKRLQADPTVIYGCRSQPSLGSCTGFDAKKPRITKAMLADGDNHYNTYRLEGLPPGPISNPGRAALGAVLLATRHDYLYFVAKGGGRHTFSATLDAHNSAVQRGRAP
jgi:UPF0755 protein